jgi:sulfate adenylyltransferase subunit 1 (EFTu-like GTPase family)
MNRHFDNTVKKDSASKWYTGKLLFEMVKNIQVAFGKGTVKRQKRKKTPTLTVMPFKKQSIFLNTFHTGKILKLTTTLI